MNIFATLIIYTEVTEDIPINVRTCSWRYRPRRATFSKLVLELFDELSIKVIIYMLLSSYKAIQPHYKLSRASNLFPKVTFFCCSRCSILIYITTTREQFMNGPSSRARPRSTRALVHITCSSIYLSLRPFSGTSRDSSTQLWTLADHLMFQTPVVL